VTLVPGTRLGPYEIVDLLGAGGMGEVYRARDTRLDRTVAVKTLPPALASHPELRDRFEREAKLLSSLEHPHICAVYDVGEHPSTPSGQPPVAYIVMQFLEGETLAARLQKRANSGLPLEEALRIAIEIADALDKAHRMGIVHRDVKPGNIMLTSAGVKLLDFGLAKLQQAAAPAAASAFAPASLSSSPTATSPLTMQGTMLGTLQYMAPEQLEGATADARSDIFGLGAVVYEMVTGRRAFEGKTHASLIGSILKDDPPPLSQVLAVPPVLDHVVRTCLAKNPEDRFQTAHDVLLELRWARERGPETGAVLGSRAPRRSHGWRGAASAGFIIGAAIAGAGVWMLKPTPLSPRPITRFTIPVSSGENRSSANSLGLAIVTLSSDGNRLAYAAGSIFVRQMDGTEAKPVIGTETGADPVFSPDGQSIAFHANGMLNRVAVAGGPVVPICPLPTLPRGISWPQSDRILFARSGEGIFEVSPSGGPARAIVAVDREKGETARRPQLLPDGQTVLFTVNNEAADLRAARAMVQSLRTGERKTVIESATDARYVDSGHLIFARDSTVFAVPFDRVRYEVRGTPTPVIEAVIHNRVSGVSHFAVAANGTLAYVPEASSARTLVWLDRKGVATPVPAPSRAYGQARLSPDGTRAIVTVAEQDRDLWMWDFGREALTRFTFTPDEENSGIWTPDGSRILFASGKGRERGLYSRPANGSGSVIRLTTDPDMVDVLSAAPDGTVLTRSRRDDGGWLSAGSWQRDSPLRRLAGGESVHWNARLSPNGRWLAYQSHESGRWEIYVRPFPALEHGRWQVSVDGGHGPVWRADGRELLFEDQYHGRVMSVSVETDGSTFSAGRPVALFPIKWFFEYGFGFDVSRDGQRFLMTRQIEPTASKIQVVLNWQEELKARVPVRK
jgi:serine/threonine protein kinase/Tol biopolymer transport system component